MTAFISLQVVAIVLAVLTAAAGWVRAILRSDRFDKLLRRVFVGSSVLCCVSVMFAAASFLAAWANGLADIEAAGILISVTNLTVLAAIVSNIAALTFFVIRESKASSATV